MEKENKEICECGHKRWNHVMDWIEDGKDHCTNCNCKKFNSMKKENSLSDKRLWFKDYNVGKIHYVYLDKDVKEFIKIIEGLSYINADGKRVVNLSDIKNKAGKNLL